MNLLKDSYMNFNTECFRFLGVSIRVRWHTSTIEDILIL